ncbi:MAG: hypothetical protein CMG13_03970 [Candidatus Marinimicrobia bacterium]|nr:hypothetical protein [Candidatus Neomarinimicrobiota bacterium]|tara:strand:+ start:13752 stop:14309 length:558 start_codon:yes stop_codon:yes gene_type:complete
MNKSSLSKGHTLIEVMTSLFIASAFSVGLYSIFVEGSKGINREHVLIDVKNYATNVLEIISSNIQDADEISIDNYLGSNVIKIETGGEPDVQYSVINNLICENGTPIKLPGHYWIDGNQGLYDVDLRMTCDANAASFYDTEDDNIRDCLYDVRITIDVNSKIDENFSESVNAYNRIFAINKFSTL